MPNAPINPQVQSLLQLVGTDPNSGATNLAAFSGGRGAQPEGAYTFPYGIGAENFAGPGGAYNEQNTLELTRQIAAESNRNHNADIFPVAQFGTWSVGDPAARAAWSNRNTASFTDGRGGAPGSGSFTPAPEDAKYFDAFNQPRIDTPGQVAADAGITPRQLAGGLFPRYGDRYGKWGQGYDYASDRGGFFRMEDLFGRDPSGTSLTPTSGRLGMSGPSTNNWRLLGQGPGWIMRNGQLIDTQSGGGMWGGSRSWLPNGGLTGEQQMGALPIGLGTGTPYGVPNLLNYSNTPSMAGWPGAANWQTVTGVLT